MKVLALLLLLAASVAAAPLTPEKLLSLPRVSEVRLSPDGRWLAVAFKDEVKVYRLSDRKAVATLAKAGGPRWSPDGKQLLVTKAGQAWVAPAGTDKLRQVTRQTGGITRPVWSPKGHIAYVADVRVTGSPYEKGQDSGRLYDDLFMRRWNQMYDGKRQHIFINGKDVTPGDYDAFPTAGTFSSGDNYCFSPDGSALIFAAPPRRGQAGDTNYDIYRLELAGGRQANLTAANLAADLGPRIFKDRLYILAHRRPGYESDFGTIKSCPIDTAGQPAGEWRDEPAKDPSEWLPTEAGMYYTSYQQAASRGFREGTPLEHKGSVHSLTADRSGQTWAATQAALDQPPRVLVNGQVFWEPPKVEMGAVESVEVPVEGGALMQMFIIKPPGFTPERRWPVAYLVHGGPQGGWGDDWSLRWNPQVWAAQGYLVAMPNPRGSSGQGAAFQEQVSRDWGGRAYRDLMAGADYMAALPYADPQRMVAAGASYGGYMVNWFAVNTGRFKALVTHCGVWNLESMYGATDELWFTDWEFGGPPWGGSPDYTLFSPHRRADQLAVHKTPHLVIHNELDYRCPLNQGLELFTALQRQGVESRLLYFPDEGHHVLKPKNGLRWYREVFAFLKRYCPPG